MRDINPNLFSEVLYEDTNAKPDVTVVSQELQDLLNKVEVLKQLNPTLAANVDTWSAYHTAAFQKYLDGFKYYCEMLKDNLANQ